jgi:asparagine synthetase B (glutamine-hydrolysing)
MLGASPHRGLRRSSLVHGACSVGVSYSGAGGASVASHGIIAAAVVGVIDNLDEVARLIPEHLQPTTRTPAAIIAAAAPVAGKALATTLRGAFSVVITDGRTLQCFRDQIGFGTLFYRQDPRGVFVATEAKQVVGGAGISREPDLDIVRQIFYSTYDAETPAAIKGVLRLPRATLLTTDAASVRLSRYWDPESALESATFSESELAQRFDELMESAVRRTLGERSIVALSGGIDSPAVAAYAAPAYREITGEALPALSMVYPDIPEADDLPYTRLVAERLGMPLHTYVPAAEPLERVQDWVDMLDGPNLSVSMPDYDELFAKARALGSDCILSGEFAEVPADQRRHLVPHLVQRGRWGAACRLLRDQRRDGMSYVALARQVASTLAPRGVLAAYELRKPDRALPAWVDPRPVREAIARWTAPARERWRRRQLLGFYGPTLSFEADALCQDVAGVRLRRPWADVDLCDFFLSLPAQVKFPRAGRKPLVRQLLATRVPAAVLNRREKAGFNATVQRRIDYGALRRWLMKTPWRVPGVDYGLLRRRLEGEDLSLYEFIWAKDLAATHAFLSLW